VSASVDALVEARHEESLYMEDYQGYVASIARQLDRIDLPTLTDRCLAVAARLEKAAGIYSDIADLWAACPGGGFSTCDPRDLVFPAMEKGEAIADRHRAAAEAALARMRTPALVPEFGFRGYNLSVPEQAGDVDDSVYGQAVAVYCGPSPAVAAVEACASLREVLAGGVSADEVDDLDEAALGLIEAHNLAPTTDA
jgi:hypothetical protein